MAISVSGRYNRSLAYSSNGSISLERKGIIAMTVGGKNGEKSQQRATEIVHQIEKGDCDAVAVLMARFGPWLEKAIAQKIGTNLQRRIDAEDIMQSTFWSFVKRTSNREYQFKHTGALCRLLLTIAENKIRREVRKAHAQIRRMDREIDLGKLLDTLSDSKKRTIARNLAEAVDEIAIVVDQLSDRDAEIFRRRYFQNESAAQISAELGWSLATIKRRLKWAIEEIRRRIESDF